MDFLAAAELVAEQSNLKIIAKRNSAGQVINYRVYRAMPDRLVFLGSRSSPSALHRIVEHFARSSP
jgi:hypothetical protein